MGNPIYKLTQMSDECFLDESACVVEGGEPMMMEEEHHGGPDGGRGDNYWHGYADEDWDGTGSYPMPSSFESAQEAWLTMALTAHVMSLLDLFVYKFQIKIDGTDADGEDEERVLHYNTEYALMAEDDSFMPMWRWGGLLHTWTLFIYSTSVVVTSILAIFGIGYRANMYAIVYLSMAEAFALWIAMMMWAWNYYKAYGVAKEDANEDDSIDTTVGGYAVAYMSAMETDMMWAALHEVGIFIFMFRYVPAWSHEMMKRLDDQ